jgi:hypothetical protein
MSFSLECESVIYWVRASDTVSPQSEDFGSQNLYFRYFPSKKSQLRQKKSPCKRKKHGTLRNSTEQFLLEKLEVAYLLKKHTQTYDTAIFIPFFFSQNSYTEPTHSYTSHFKLKFYRAYIPHSSFNWSRNFRIFCLKHVCPLYVISLPIMRKSTNSQVDSGKHSLISAFKFNLIILITGWI